MSAILKGRPKLDRSAEAYKTFVSAPVHYVEQRLGIEEGHLLVSVLFGETVPVNYVVKSDLAAFYQFIDHSVLAEELLRLGADYELIEALLSLLEEVQGRNYGLPQLLDSSDELSEVYADRIERSLLRAGYAVWRFNDDFRIACDTYADAIAAIETLDTEARLVGLVLAEHKTVTPRFLTYVSDTYDLATAEPGATISNDDVEALVGGYEDDFEDDADAALAVIRSAQVSRDKVVSDEEAADVDIEVEEARWLNLRSLPAADLRLLRRALNGMAAALDTRALPDIVRLAEYAPSLTPNLMRYLSTVAASDPEGVADVVDELLSGVGQGRQRPIHC